MTYLAATAKVPYGMPRMSPLVHRIKDFHAWMHDGKIRYYATWYCTNTSANVRLLAEPGDRDMCFVCKFAGPLVYRYYDVRQHPVYIGVTDSYIVRQMAHERSSRWWPEVASVRLERFATYHEALVAERRAIRAEHPVHNVMYRVKVHAA